MLRPIYGWTNAGLMLCQRFRWWAIISLALCQRLVFAVELSHATGHSPNAVSMLGQHRRRRANIETALGKCPVFAEEAETQAGMGDCPLSPIADI